MSQLRITEIFYSLQGETSTVGLPTVFIRLTGCPLRCGYCDTAYAFKGGEIKTIDSILQQVSDYKAKYITVTGGEPLAQKACLELLTELCDQDYIVSLETSGALDVSEVDPRVVKVMDLKTPGSKELDKNLYSNVEFLNPHDQVKFVILDQEDYQWTKQIIKQYELEQRCHILVSPCHNHLPIAKLADWILADNLPVRLQLQLHKYIWGDEPGR